MLQRLFNFLKSLFGQNDVALSYSDKVTKPGLSVVFYEDVVNTDKNLDGTTNLYIGNYVVEIWHDTLVEASEACESMLHAMEGTEFQVQIIRPVRIDGRKRKWHQQIGIQIMEEA